MYHPDEWIERMLTQAEERRKQHLDMPWKERRELLLQALGKTMGDFADMPRTNPAARTIERIELDSFVRERIEYSTAAGLRVPAYVLSPNKAAAGPKPAILALHGHGWGSREMAGLLPDGSPNAKVPSGHGDTAEQLVNRGFVVMIPEIIGFGDRKLARDQGASDPKANSCFALAAALLLAGKTLAGLRVYEASRAIDVLQQRKEVDPDRVGVIGFSGGGMVASLTAAVDERVRAAAIYGYSNTYRSSILARNHCLDNYLPGILQSAEMPEWLALIAPRPLFIESGLNDPLFPEHGVREAIRELERTYREMDAESRLAYDLFPGGHEMNGRQSFDWLQSVV